MGRKSKYPSIDYLASQWRILEDAGFEYIFPPESEAWVTEPDGILRVYRSLPRRVLNNVPISKAWITHRIWAKDEQVKENGFVTAHLDGLFRLPAEEESRMKFYHAGKFTLNYRYGDVHLVSIA